MNGRGTMLMNSGSVTARGQLIPIQWIDVQVSGIKVRQQNSGELRASLKKRRPPIVRNQIRMAFA